ncbi:putative ABC transport system ATP-binding protein [Micromonospora echinospora]|uniref:Putative ABC transport system ATP-binding protein n=1 Tax=Micromonospora echinospora TaxID=1877 RepID=A0A1C4ZJE1_MICEC|nr:ABC transporter ATP-binding protein [Micromonospora echinospora]SCF33032.1 putative ABC transport system ATP-binding protein [Micromonospora echinospora]
MNGEPSADDHATATGLLRRAVRRHLGRLSATLALLCVHQAAEALVPVAIGLIIDRAVATGDSSALTASIAGLGLLFVVIALAWRFGAAHGLRAMEREAHLLRVEISRLILDPRDHRTGMRDGELLAVASTDVTAMATVIRAVSMAASASTALAVSCIALLVIDAPFGLGVLVGAVIVVTVLQRLAPLLTRRGIVQQTTMSATTALATDLLHGVRVLHGLGAQGNASRRYAQASARQLAATVHTANVKGLHQGLTVLVSGLYLAGVTAAAGWLAVRGRITVGELIAVVGLAQFAAEPLQRLGFCVQLHAGARASAQRIARVLAAAPTIRPGDRTPLPHAETRLALDAVSYRTLERLTLAVHADETLGVVTDDPGDADALLMLLSGRVPRHEYTGTVTIDGVPAEQLDLDAARATVLVEPHRVALFDGTLRSNLLPGHRSWTTSSGRDSAAPAVDDGQHRLATAIRAAAADDVVAGHPDELDRPLTGQGTNLSGGQRQRVGLARALAADPPVLVLHEPTTSVDPVTESLIADGLAQARQGGSRSTVVVTTSPTLLNATHRVVVIRAGRLVAEGTHADLVATEPAYREAVLR